MAEQRDWLDYVNVIGGLIMGLVTFLFGFALSSIIEKKKSRKEQQEVRNYFELYWKEQLRSTEAMINEMDTFASGLEDLKGFNGVRLTMELQPFFMYDSMDKQKLVESFRVVGKRELLVLRMKYIELIRESIGLLMRHHDAFYKRNDENREKWNISQAAYLSSKMLIDTEIIRCLADGIAQPPELAEIIRFINISEYSEPYDLVSNVVEPLEAHLIDIYTAIPDHPIASSMLPALQGFKRAASDNKTHSMSVADLINNQVAFLRKIHENFKTPR